MIVKKYDNWDQCYFKANDVSIRFGLPKLRAVITNNVSTYKEGKHYITPIFNVPGHFKSVHCI